MSRAQCELELFFEIMHTVSLEERQTLLENFYEKCTSPALQDRIVDEANNVYQKRLHGSALLTLPSKLESITVITANHLRS